MPIRELDRQSDQAILDHFEGPGELPTSSKTKPAGGDRERGVHNDLLSRLAVARVGEHESDEPVSD